MPTDEGRKAARLAVAREVARMGTDGTKLAVNAGVHPQTVQALLAGTRWPSLRTLGKLDAALGWPAGTLNGIAEEDVAPADETVSAPVDDGRSLMFMRPPGVSDDDWDRIRTESRDHIEWLIEKAQRRRMDPPSPAQ